LLSFGELVLCELLAKNETAFFSARKKAVYNAGVAALQRSLPFLQRYWRRNECSVKRVME
jgi:hypothetical protein